MNIKIDTKEKFTVITPNTEELSANMTDQLLKSLEEFYTKAIPHIVLNLATVKQIDEKSCEKLVLLQQKFYENSSSFVVCCLQKQVENFLDEQQLLEVMNVTPTESEAWDIIQMEEIERELMDDENF
jgi:anti-anti-sigma factor